MDVDPKVPNFNQRFLNSPKMEICENIWSRMGKVGGEIPKNLKGVIDKVKIGLKKPVSAS